MSNSNTLSNTTTLVRIEDYRRNPAVLAQARRREPAWFACLPHISPAEEETFAAFERDALQDLAPEGLAELEFFHDFVRATWRERQAQAAMLHYAGSTEAAAFLRLTQATYERRARIARRSLLSLQAARAATYQRILDSRGLSLAE